jgi:hypothetical protein
MKWRVAIGILFTANIHFVSIEKSFAKEGEESQV